MAYRNYRKEFTELLEATTLTVAGVALLVFFAFL